MFFFKVTTLIVNTSAGKLEFTQNNLLLHCSSQIGIKMKECILLVDVGKIDTRKPAAGKLFQMIKAQKTLLSNLKERTSEKKDVTIKKSL